MPLWGHACRNAMPNEYPQWQDISWERLDYPIIPQSWITKPREDRSQGKMLRDLKAKLDHCDAIICATDSDAKGTGSITLSVISLNCATCLPCVLSSIP